MNDSALDTVHIQMNTDEISDEINEYLSSVALSAEAFRDLTEVCLKIDRPVIICMVGDHAPAFINNLSPTISRNNIEDNIVKRMVPYIIWTNYGADLSDCGEYLSMTDIVPTILRIANLPLSPYYQMILDLNNVIPVRTSDGTYMDHMGNYGEINAQMPLYQQMQQYYYAEYASLEKTENYSEILFQPVCFN